MAVLIFISLLLLILTQLFTFFYNNVAMVKVQKELERDLTECKGMLRVAQEELTKMKKKVVKPKVHFEELK